MIYVVPTDGLEDFKIVTCLYCKKSIVLRDSETIQKIKDGKSHIICELCFPIFRNEFQIDNKFFTFVR